jgi:YVTN family beta-propeller protein
MVVALVLVAAGANDRAANATATLGLGTPMSSPAGSLVSGPRANGTGVLPDGRVVTPVGDVAGVGLLPLNAVLSHDGSRLYVSSEGGDNEPTADEDDYDRAITVVDTATMETTTIDDDALQYGLAESPDGSRLYVSEGETGTVGVFDVSAQPARRVREIALDPADFPWGLTLGPEGRYAYVAGFRGNSLSVLDTTTGARVGRVATGQYPFGVVVSPDGTRAWVSNWGLFNPEADEVATNVDAVSLPPFTIGGYNTEESSSVWEYDLSDPTQPTVVRKIRVGLDLDGVDVLSGSLPSGMSLSPDGATLAVTASNNDLVVLLDTASGTIRETIDLHVLPGGPTGAQPNAVAWAPDGSVLFVAEGGRNAVALIDPATGVVRGRIPTGWYPSAVAPSADGDRLFIASAKGLGAGPNGVEIDGAHPTQDGTGASYIGNLLDGIVQRVDLALACSSLSELTFAVDRANGLLPGDGGDGSVVPTAYGQGPSRAIRHVVFILKENRTYDQVLGDLAGTERDERLAFYGGPVTPNHHAVATEFAHGDNYYDVGQDSFDGHFVIDSGHVNEFDQKLHPTVWNANKLGPEGLYVSAPENLPIEGLMWNNLFRHDVSFRIYGEAVFLLGLAPSALVPPVNFDAADQPRGLIPALFAASAPASFSATYPSQVTPSRPAFGEGNTDEDRADDFLRELSLFEATGTMPSFSFLWMTDDHTQGATPGALTPESHVARNDRALGRILDGLSHSRFWDDMAIFVTEDDPQDGQDHVDAHRTLQLVLSPYARRGYVSDVHHSNLSTLKTINLLLGVPPMSIQEATATSLADYFQPAPQLEPRYDARDLQIPYETNPAPGAASNSTLAAATALQTKVPAGVDEGGDLLQEVLRLRHEGAVAAGSPNAFDNGDEVEHRLDVGSPEPVVLDDASGDGSTEGCAVVAGASTTQTEMERAGGGRLPATGGHSEGLLAAGLLLGILSLASRGLTRRG